MTLSRISDMSDAELLVELKQAEGGIQDATSLLQEAMRRGLWPPPPGTYLSRRLTFPGGDYRGSTFINGWRANACLDVSDISKGRTVERPGAISDSGSGRYGAPRRSSIKWWQYPSYAAIGLWRLLVSFVKRLPWNTENR